MYALSKICLLCMSLVPCYWCFLSPLQNILSTRAFIYAIQRRIFYEFLDTNNIVGALEQFQENHHIDPWILGSFTISSAWFIYRGIDPRYDINDAKIIKWSDYTVIEKRVNLFILVFMLIMTKNIENVI